MKRLACLLMAMLMTLSVASAEEWCSIPDIRAQTLHTICYSCLCRKEDYRNLLTNQVFTQRKSIFARHHNVEQYEIRFLLL